MKKPFEQFAADAIASGDELAIFSLWRARSHPEYVSWPPH